MRQAPVAILEETDRVPRSVGRPMRTDFSTISDAYSQDWETRPMRASASRVMPRMPQWMSVKWLP